MARTLQSHHSHNADISMNLALEILPQEQLTLYKHLKPIKDLGFVLFGGTAIALQLGHRHSIDFDFFTHQDLSPLHSTLLNLPNIQVSEITQQVSDTLIFTTQSGVKMSFFGGLEFVTFTKKIPSDDGIIEVANLESLLITKLKATCDRAEYKDYKDIIAILQSKQTSLQKAFNNFHHYFGDKFPIIQILKGLTYFEDGDLDRLSKQEKDFLLNEVKNINTT